MFFEYEVEEDRMGMSLQPGTVTLQKDSQNLIGISIGGGSPLCPCLYIVQVFDNTPAAKIGVLEAGDEIVAVNSTNVKGKTKVEVARMIQNVKSEVHIGYNKLTCDAQQGKSFDILVKKVKHKMVENMSSSTADALGLSRAILCNDGLIKKMQEMDKIADMYRGLMNNTQNILRGFFQLSQAHRMLGDVLAEIGAREPQELASEGFRRYGEAHRHIEKFGIKLLKTLKPMVSDLHTYLHKAVPDTKLTIKRYADIKFEYLSFCLKVKEMDDEEYSYAAICEPLYRVETGNYEYRLVLRCRQESRTRFARLRSDVLEKIELLDNKHVQDIVFQLQRFICAMTRYNNDSLDQLQKNSVFPIEVDLLKSTLNCDKKNDFSEDGEAENEQEEDDEEDDDDQLISDMHILASLEQRTASVEDDQDTSLIDAPMQPQPYNARNPGGSGDFSCVNLLD